MESEVTRLKKGLDGDELGTQLATSTLGITDRLEYWKAVGNTIVNYFKSNANIIENKSYTGYSIPANRDYEFELVANTKGVWKAIAIRDPLKVSVKASNPNIFDDYFTTDVNQVSSGSIE
jgi:hypothetical protein